MGTPPADAPPADWYPDPAEQGELRYWDGESWTDGVVKGGQVVEDPLRPEAVKAAWEQRRDRRAPWPARVAVLALAGAVAASLLAAALGVVAHGLSGGSDFVALLASQAGLWVALLLTCWGVSRRYGNGDVPHDYALRFRRSDVAVGLGLSVLARLLAVAVVVPVVVLLGEPVQGNVQPVDKVAAGPAGAAVLVVFLLVGAPLVEELFFRGLLQRALETRLAAPAAIALQALVFGLAHLSVQLGAANLAIFAVTAVGGLVLGAAARHYHRLGPSIATHSWFNVLPAVAVVLT